MRQGEESAARNIILRRAGLHIAVASGNCVLIQGRKSTNRSSLVTQLPSSRRIAEDARPPLARPFHGRVNRDCWVRPPREPGKGSVAERPLSTRPTRPSRCNGNRGRCCFQSLRDRYNKAGRICGVRIYFPAFLSQHSAIIALLRRLAPSSSNDVIESRL